MPQLMRIAMAILLFLCLSSPAAGAPLAVVHPTLDATAPLSPVLDATTMPEQPTTIWGKPHTLVWTFDDHPSRWTDETLDILTTQQLKATFFIVAYPLWNFYRVPSSRISQTHLLQVRRVAQQGHLVGGHSLTHKKMCQLSQNVLRRFEFDLSQALLKRALGIAPRLWRPPHGELCRIVWNETKRLNLTVVMWDLADYHTSALRMITLLKRRVEAGLTRTIILFHPTNNALLKQFLQLLAVVQQTPTL